MQETYEVEVKIPIVDEEAIIEEILQAKGKRLNAELQSDMYFDHPCRSFSETDESVRIRSRSSLDSELLQDDTQLPIELTYKGPKVDKTTKTRLEFTSIVDSIETITAILQHTGFKHVATIAKRRIFYDIDSITISIDNVDNVGRYIEFELIAKDKEEMEEARRRIVELIERLGLDSSNSVRESYLELYLERVSS